MIYSDLKEGALTEIKRTQFSKLGIWKGSHLSMEDVQAHPGALATGARELARWLWKIRAPSPPPEGNPLTEVRLIKHAVRIGETRGIQWYRIQSDTASSQIYGLVYHKLFSGSSGYSIHSWMAWLVSVTGTSLVSIPRWIAMLELKRFN